MTCLVPLPASVVHAIVTERAHRWVGEAWPERLCIKVIAAKIHSKGLLPPLRVARKAG